MNRAPTGIAVQSTAGKTRRGTCRFTSAGAALLAVLLACGAFGAEAVTAGGEVVEGRLSGTPPVLRLKSGASVALGEVARVKLRAESEGAALVSGVRLRDGSVIRGRVTVGAHGVRVVSARLGELEIPMGAAAEIFFDCHEGLGEDSGAGVLLKNGDFLPAERIEIGAREIAVESVAGSLELPVERIAAVRLAEAEPPRREVSVVLDNHDLLCGTLESAGAEFVTVSSALGDIEVSTDYVCQVNFPARIKYVSDMDIDISTHGFAPEGVTYVFLDRGPKGALRAGGEWYRKGLFARSGASVGITLPKGARALCFAARIADGSNPAAGVFSVRAGGRELWKARFESSSPGAPVVLSVAGASSLELRFVSEPPGLLGAAGIWGDAFVTVNSAE